MLTQLKKRKEGFTIIEVLIVLAIAGLIMLIVFLAVPALQRNARNTQRTNDASLIASAVNECLGNRNGQTASCDTLGELTTLDTTKLSQLTNVNVTSGAPTAPTSGTGDTANIGFGRKCNSAGSGLDTANLPRAVAVLFNTESTTGANISRCLES